eukprot:5849151-Amphidinium_carterae.1
MQRRDLKTTSNDVWQLRPSKLDQTPQIFQQHRGVSVSLLQLRIPRYGSGSKEAPRGHLMRSALK